MKRILITGANSYIGTSFEKYINDNCSDKYTVNTVNMLSDSWRLMSFNGYDTVLHVAGIAHTKETEQNAHLFYVINRDLAIETAKKAKIEGVKQFIYLSSMSVYGKNTGIITRETAVKPMTHYGKSKLQAEEHILPLNSEMFSVSILRLPMVYGEGCKGNYQTLVKCAKSLPIFPDIKNRRSMINIELMCRYMEKVISEEKRGLMFPQDSNYTCTTQMVKEIADKANHKIVFTKLFNPIIKICPIKLFMKVFGDLIYKDME